MAVLDPEFEEQVLAAALRRTSFTKQAVRVARPEHFATAHHSWIWGVLQDTFLKHKERPSGKIFLAKARKEFAKDDKWKEYISVLKKLWKKRIKAPKSCLAELDVFVKSVEYQKLLERGADQLEKDDLEGLRKTLAKSARIGTEKRDYTHIQWIEELESRQEERKYQAENPDEFIVVPTGYPSLDRAISGGVRVGELNLVMGTTGRGKSIMLNNLVMCALRKGYRVLYVALEMPARQIAARQDSRWSGVEYNKFKEWKLSSSELRTIERKHRASLKKYKNKYHILSWPVRGADVNSIMGAIYDLEIEFSFRPDVIFIDSPDHMNAIEAKNQDLRIQHAEVYWSLKAMAEEEGFVIWGSVHAKASAAKTTARAEDSAEAYDKSRIADLIISINDPDAGRRGKDIKVSEEDEEDEEAMIEGPGTARPGLRKLEGFMAKYRDGDSNFRFPLTADFARMHIYEEKKDQD